MNKSVRTAERSEARRTCERARHVRSGMPNHVMLQWRKSASFRLIHSFITIIINSIRSNSTHISYLEDISCATGLLASSLVVAPPAYTEDRRIVLLSLKSLSSNTASIRSSRFRSFHFLFSYIILMVDYSKYSKDLYLYKEGEA